jgi:hypothetical protein
MGTFAPILGVAGGIVGGVFGGPVGAMAGGAVGGAAGGLVDNALAKDPGAPDASSAQPSAIDPGYNQAAMDQQRGIAAGESARNASLLSAVQNLNAAQSLGAQGAQVPMSQSVTAQPAAIDRAPVAAPSLLSNPVALDQPEVVAQGAPIVVPNPQIRPRPYPQQPLPRPTFAQAADYYRG